MKILVFVLLLLTAASNARAENCAAGMSVPAGEYVVTDLRRPSDVESAPLSGEYNDILGQLVSFDKPMIWLNGLTPDDFSFVHPIVAPIYPADPILSDALVGPREVQGFKDCLKMDSLAIKSDGKTLAIITMVDSRILIAPIANRSLYAILEKPLEAKEISRLQLFLEENGHYKGNITGVMDKKTRTGVALYAETRGAQYRFAHAVISENLLFGLGIFNSE